MREDFGYFGDEFLLGDCRDDWGMATVQYRQEVMAEERDDFDENEGKEEDDCWGVEDEIMDELQEEEDLLILKEKMKRYKDDDWGVR